MGVRFISSTQSLRAEDDRKGNLRLNVSALMFIPHSNLSEPTFGASQLLTSGQTVSEPVQVQYLSQLFTDQLPV